MNVRKACGKALRHSLSHTVAAERKLDRWCTKSTYTVTLADRGLLAVVHGGGDEHRRNGAGCPVATASICGDAARRCRPAPRIGQPRGRRNVDVLAGRIGSATADAEYKYSGCATESVIASGTSYVVTAEDRGYSLTCKVMRRKREGHLGRKQQQRPYTGMSPKTRRRLKCGQPCCRGNIQMPRREMERCANP